LCMRADYPEWLVLEVGADRPGDIKRLASWLPVDIAVLTTIPEIPAHIEFFPTKEHVIAEKSNIAGGSRIWRHSYLEC
jgi:UDP-N-acetylmuramoyl-tripeptide--D-alanyl-D-alanine ligase